MINTGVVNFSPACFLSLHLITLPLEAASCVLESFVSLVVATERKGILSAGVGFKTYVIPWLLWDVLSLVFIHSASLHLNNPAVSVQISIELIH